MFTGIVQEIGSVVSLERSSDLLRLTVHAKAVSASAGIGDSVAVNGACLTVVARSAGTLTFEAMAQTIGMTTIGALHISDSVNLEGALRAQDALGGHLVLGHIDDIATVAAVRSTGTQTEIVLELPARLLGYLIPQGSIAVDGVSLTIGKIDGSRVHLYIIPHTLRATTLGGLTAGRRVNIECDPIGKYVVEYLSRTKAPTVTESFLREHGFL